MFDKLWEESPTVQKMREQIREKYRVQYYEEGINQGIAQGVQRTLVDVVQVRFPDLTEFAQKQVKLCNKPDTLELLFQKMLTAPDATVARQLLESMPEQE
jgi:flagellar biosynthesis/type III secretory pathway protein FliH